GSARRGRGGRRIAHGRFGRDGFRTVSRRIGFRFGRRATTRDQAARPATQAAARTIFAAGILRGLLGSVVGARCPHGMRGFGRISVVGICQNNLEMSGLAPVAGAAISIWPRQARR
ncbi:hypothetical protein, partial [Burkholderia sp. Ac-20379]|uniref:hypothetical protein n=1 Tax=Burkholderia sp. Ac-20379 TaxID=2703900 RepID=UPI00403FB6D7